MQLATRKPGSLLQSIDYSENKMQQLKNECDSTQVCPLCDNQSTLIFDPESNEVICSSCGMVIFESSELESQDYGTYSTTSTINTGIGDHKSLSLPDKGLSTLISASNMDARGSSFNLTQRGKAYKLRKWNNISHTNTSYQRNLRNAFSILNILKDKLSLTDVLIERSAYYYRKAFEKRLIKGRSIVAFVVASTYIACRELKIPRSLDEIANASNADSIFAGKCYRNLIRHLKLQYTPIDCTTHMLKIAKNSRISEKSSRAGLELLKAVKENSVSYGKAPDALAAAALYFACIKEGEKIGQQKIASAARISVVTLRKRIDDIIKVVSPNDSQDA